MIRRFPALVQTIGIVTVLLVLGKYHAAVVADPAYDFSSSSRLVWTGVYALALVVAAYGFGLPEHGRSRRDALFAACAATLVAALAISGLQLVLGSLLLPRFVVFGSALLFVPWFFGLAGLARDARSWEASRDRVVLVGDWVDGADLEAELADRAERAATVVAVLAPETARLQADGTAPLRAAVRDGAATVVVLDRVAQLEPSIIDQVAALHEDGVRVRTLSLFCEQWLGKIPVSELERVSLMFDIGELHRIRYGRVKRMADVALAAAGLIALAVLVPVVWVGNRVANRGPLFYRQPRVGRGGQVFSMLKFRTMRADAAAPTTWTAERDPRITPWGGLLRRSHLDELPQVWNILRGDLSVVGPRPEQPQYVAELVEKLPFYQLRHLVRPGLTGWAQVKYGYAGNDRDALEKLQYEFYYLRHQRLALDARIVVRTLRHVLRGGGR